MIETSNWPLSQTGRRLLTPRFLLTQLAEHPLSRGCYPTALGYYPSADGHGMAREEHRDNLLIFCIAGRGSLEVDAGVHAVHSGDALLLPRGKAHSYRANRQHPWTIYWVHFDGNDAREFVTWLQGYGLSPVAHCGVEPPLLSGFEQLLASVHVGATLDTYIRAANRLRQLLTQFDRRHTRPGDARLGAIDAQSLQEYMRAHIAQRLTLEDLAALARLSPQHLASRYRQHTGFPPLQHFQHMKMEAACQLLDSTEDSVQRIAGALGYSDPLYFSRVFRRTLGLSPTAYRKSQRR